MRHLREVKKSAEFCGEERVTRSNIDDLPVTQVSQTSHRQHTTTVGIKGEDSRYSVNLNITFVLV